MANMTKTTHLVKSKPKMLEDVRHLEEENLELKLNDIRKDITVLEEKLCLKLDEIITHVKETNGSVAKVTEANNKLRASFQSHCIEAATKLEKLDKVDEETKTVRWLFKHPKIWYIVVVLFIIVVSNEALTTAMLLAIRKLLNIE